MIRSADRPQKKPQRIIGGKRLRLNLLSLRIVLARSDPPEGAASLALTSMGSWLTTLPRSSENLNAWRSASIWFTNRSAFLISHP